MAKFLFILLIITVQSFGQSFNQIIIDEKSEKPMLIGYTNRNAFTDTTFSWWFNTEYDDYDVEEGITSQLSPLFEDISIKIVMGTWCSDSRREVPHFYKILDLSNFQEKNLTVINVDRKKLAEEIDLSDLKIELVPTFIIYRD
ncbi:MAG TPA: hypothetical protein PK559_01680, partial [Ignavibacteriaceae bacterium]|nr:hypothetical protein [Ignavibacteriaceae bacterium]